LNDETNTSYVKLNKQMNYEEKEIIYREYHKSVNDNVLHEMMEYLGKGKIGTIYSSIP
jgi:hypothetical protein